MIKISHKIALLIELNDRCYQNTFHISIYLLNTKVKAFIWKVPTYPSLFFTTFYACLFNAQSSKILKFIRK